MLNCCKGHFGSTLDSTTGARHWFPVARDFKQASQVPSGVSLLLAFQWTMTPSSFPLSEGSHLPSVVGMLWFSWSPCWLSCVPCWAYFLLCLWLEAVSHCFYSWGSLPTPPPVLASFCHGWEGFLVSHGDLCHPSFLSVSYNTRYHHRFPLCSCVGCQVLQRDMSHSLTFDA